MIRQSLGLSSKTDGVASHRRSQSPQLTSVKEEASTRIEHVKEEASTRIEHVKEDASTKSEYSRDALIELGRQQRRVSTEARVEDTTGTGTIPVSQPVQTKSMNLEVPVKSEKTHALNESDVLVRGKALSPPSPFSSL